MKTKPKPKKTGKKSAPRPKITAAVKPYFRTDTIRIFRDDLLKTRAIPQGSVDLIVTSPPYNVDIAYSQHDDRTGYREYLKFIGRSLARLLGLARPGGRLCLNIALDKNKGGQQSISADVTTRAKAAGWKYHSTIIWNEQSISRRTAWGSWMSASAPYVIAPVEVILVLYKGEWKREGGREQSDITRDEFMAWTNGVWNFPGETKRKSIGHPSPFPIELPRRCIKLFSFVGDTVLDPFLGSGSTLLACLRTRRKGIGVDIDPKYCALAKARVTKAMADASNPLFDQAGVPVKEAPVQQGELFGKS